MKPTEPNGSIPRPPEPAAAIAAGGPSARAAGTALAAAVLEGRG